MIKTDIRRDLLEQLSQRAELEGRSINDLLAALLNGTASSTVYIAAIREREEQLRSLFDQATVGIALLNLDGTPAQLNPKVISFLGYQPDEMGGFTFRTVTHPDDMNASADTYIRLLSGEASSITTSKRYLCKDGRMKWARTTISLYRDFDNQPRHFMVVIEDIDELKQTEASLRANEQLLKTILELLPVAVTISRVDDQTVLYANSQAAAQIADTTPDALIGTVPRNVYVRARDREALITKIRETGAVYDYEAYVVRPDGSYGWRLINVRLIEFEGQPALLSGFLDITNRKIVEQSLRESEAIFGGVISSAMDAVIAIEEDETITIFNRAAELIFKCPAGEALGKPLSRFIPEQFRRIHSHHIQHFGTTGATSRSMRSLNELQALRADGTIFPIEATISQVTLNDRKLYTVILRDISERKRVEQAVRENEARFSGIVNSAMDAVISLNAEQNIIVFNHAAEAMFGVQAAEVIGKPLSRFIPELYRDVHQQHIQNFGRTGVTLRSMHSLNMLNALRANGEEFPIEATISQMDLDREKIYTVILRDITERRRIEALTLENEKTRLALEKERELLALKGRFISTVSHEFRTPLAMMITSSDLLERYADRMTPERKEEAIHNIRKQGRELVSLMNDVLVYNKATAGHVEFHPATIPLETLIATVREEVQPLCNPDRHRLVVENPDSVDTLWADADLLKRVLINLLSNAIKYSPDGGEIRLLILREPTRTIFRIIDQGIGIPAHDQPHLFEPFHRAANVVDISGTGLGLSIVKEFVDVHSGEITVESAEGKGTTFTVALPNRPAG